MPKKKFCKECYRDISRIKYVQFCDACAIDRERRRARERSRRNRKKKANLIAKTEK